MIYDSYVAYETAKELAEEREMKKEAKDIKVKKINVKYALNTGSFWSNLGLLKLNFCQTRSGAFEFFEQVKAVRKRLLETPKESGNEEVTFILLFLFNFSHNQVNKKMLRAAKILERMVNQNTYDEIAQGIHTSSLTLCQRFPV